MNYKLGKLTAQHDPRTLALEAYVTVTQLPARPLTVDYSGLITDWGILANDKHGCCTCSSAGHMTQLWGALDGKPAPVSDLNVLALYALVNNGVDGGAACLDVLKMWRKVGLAGDKPFGFVSVDVKSQRLVESAVQLFSGVYIGVQLPLTAQDQIGKLWRPTTGPEAVPGSWGGHCVSVTGYDQKGLTVITWGKTQRMSWPFWAKYVDEAFAIMPASWETLPAGQMPTGIDIAALAKDLSRL